MRALVVYESMFGNTEAIARAVAGGLGECLPVDVCEVSRAPQQIGDDVAILVVGAPTHALGLSRPGTREDAARQAAESGVDIVSTGPGVREWLESMVPGTAVAATFDTHATAPIPGTASGAAGRRLRHLGFEVREHKSFHVTGTLGPLSADELPRARQWGHHLGSDLTSKAQGAGARGLHRPVIG